MAMTNVKHAESDIKIAKAGIEYTNCTPSMEPALLR